MLDLTRSATQAVLYLFVRPIVERFSSCLLLLWQEVPQREIIHNVLHILDPVLQSVTTAAQTVVLEVEDLEASKQVLDELVDEKRTLIVTKSDRVACETCLRDCQRFPV